LGAAQELELGNRLKAARERLGWSREELAVHAGISWSAIAQAESGRRRNLRPHTLSRLSAALGVSMDYLVNGGPTPTMLAHQALLYQGEDDFVQGTGRFLLEGIERSEPGLAVTTKRNLALLKKNLGRDASHLELVEWASLDTTPEAVMERFTQFMTACLRDGAAWVRIVGEPVWAGRSSAEIRRWSRYESLINLIFAGSPMSILCPYDVSAVSPAIVREAHVTHPELVEGEAVTASSRFADPGKYALGS
jgi:transcriptional regulator with XRE-family HTH domain